MKNSNVTGKSNRIIKLIACGLIMTAMLICLSGCRDRITNRDDADREVEDKTGTMAADYEKRRDQLDLEQAVKSLMKNKKRPQQEKSQEEKQKEENSKNTEGNNSNGNTNNKDKNSGKGEGSNDKGKSAKKGDGGKKNGNSSSGTEGSGPAEGGDPGEGEGKEEKAKTILVRFDPNGGECVPANDNSREYKSGKEYASFPNVRRNNYTFAGWYTGSDGGTEVRENSIVPEGDHTLYAHWIKGSSESSSKEYTVTFDPNGGRVSAKKRTMTIKANQPYGAMPVPIRDGYDFDGWFTAKDNGERVNEDSVFKWNHDQTLYAHWNYDPYKFWSFKLNNILESMYACQIIDCYIEFEDNVTASSCELLSGCNAGNAARNRGSDVNVTDEWVESRNPDIVIKCKGSPSNASSLQAAMAKRFPDRRILVVPSAAVSGSNNEKLFYKLALGKAIYPKWYEEADLDKAAGELGVSGSVYE